MRNRLIYAALGIVGVLLIGLAIASATVWRADSVLRASATADQAIVVTDPGVLEMAGDPVTVTATVPTGDRVVLAIGRDTDVDGWVGTADHQRSQFLAADPGHQVAGSHRCGQHLAHPAQDLVAGGVPVLVVEPLEVVDVRDQQPERGVPPGTADHAVEPGCQAPAVTGGSCSSEQAISSRSPSIGPGR